MISPTRTPPDVDTLARRLRRRELSPERSEALRAALLDAADSPRPWRSRHASLGWLLGAAAAAAIVVLIVLGTGGPGRDGGRQGSTAAVEIATPRELPDGNSTISTQRPVQLARGATTITAPSGARFAVSVQRGEVQKVAVTAGWVVVASSHATTVIVERQTWTLPAQHLTASVDAITAPDRSPVHAAPDGASASPASAAAAPVPSRASASPHPMAASGSESRGVGPPTAEPAGRGASPVKSTPPVPSRNGPASPAPAPSSTAPAEISAQQPVEDSAARPPQAAAPRPPPPEDKDFRDGLRTLLAGNARDAIAALERACSASSSNQPDICYWAAVALLRSGDRERARLGFTQVVNRWPGSTHIGEANVALGWLLLERGDRTGARARFAAAADDRMTKVRAEALRGLAAAQ